MNNRAKTFRERREEKKESRIFNAITILIIAVLWLPVLNGIAEAMAK